MSAHHHASTPIRSIQSQDREPLATLIAKDGLFTPPELKVALELIDGALADPAGDYRVRVAEVDGRIAGYICFGPSPMTEGAWDLYWIVTDPEARGRGLASQLVGAMEEELRKGGARLVRVETSSLELYGAAQRFYVRTHYPEVARLPDFYKPGDDLIIMMKRL